MRLSRLASAQVSIKNMQRQLEHHPEKLLLNTSQNISNMSFGEHVNIELDGLPKFLRTDVHGNRLGSLAYFLTLCT